MKLKKLIAAALACIIIGGTFNVPTDGIRANRAFASSETAYTEVVDGIFTFRVSDTYAELVKCDKAQVSGTLALPSAAGGRSVTTIDNNVFEKCSGLTSVIIPDTYTKIGSYAFFGCKNLRSVTLSSSLRTIGTHVFYECTSLESLSLPKTLSKIGEQSFKNCSSLTSITVDADNASFTSVDGILFKKDKTALLQYPIGRKTESYTIPDYVTTIGDHAFSNLVELQTINIPDGVKTIGKNAFSSCSALTSVTIPDSVTTIGDNAFNSCSELASVKFPNSELTIGTQSFMDCFKLSEITIPEKTKKIGNRAFDTCAALTKITILSPDCKIYDSELVFSNLYTGITTTFNAVIYGYDNSTAKDYAEKYSRPFISLGAAPETTTTTATTTTATTTSASSTETSSTSSTTSSTSSDPTDTTTSTLIAPPIAEPIYDLGDVDNDKKITAYDASLVLTEYTNRSSGAEQSFNRSEFTAADVDRDLKITAYDASMILTYYTFKAKGISLSFEEFLEDPSVVTATTTTTTTTTTTSAASSSAETSEPSSETSSSTTTSAKTTSSTTSASTSTTTSTTSTTATTTADPNKIIGIYLDKTELELEVGNGEMPIVTMFPPSAKDKREIWESSDTSVATVNSDGYIKGISEGSCVVTVKSVANPEITAQVNVTVSDPNRITKIELDKTILVIDIGKGDMPIVTMYPETAGDKSEIWTSSNPNIAVVNYEGYVVGIAEGECTVTVQSKRNPEVSAQVKVVVNDPNNIKAIALTKTEMTLNVGEGDISIVTMYPEEAKDKREIWTSSDSNVAAVSFEGYVTAVSPGECIITVTSASNPRISAQIKVTVKDPDQVTRIELNRKEMIMLVGERLIASAKVYPEKAENKRVLWTSSDENTAYVDEYGYVTGLSAGTCEITARSAAVPEVYAVIKVTVE